MDRDERESAASAAKIDGSVEPPALAGGALPSSIAWIAATLREGHTIRTLLSVLAAWATTAAPAAFARGSPGSAKLLALAALLAGLAGPLLPVRRIARHVGITLFLALTTAAWLAASAAIQPARLDPTRAFLGAIAWAAFALSWSDPWKPAPPEPADPSAPELAARSSLPALAVAIAGLGVAAALACLLLGWRVTSPGRAILAQSAALACAIGLVTASATVAIARGARRSTSGRRLSPVATRSLVLLAAFAVAGAIVIALR